jgi:hypothetical protein
VSIEELLERLRLTAVGHPYRSGEGHQWETVKVSCGICDLWLSYCESRQGFPDIFLTIKRPDSNFSKHYYYEFSIFKSTLLDQDSLIWKFNCWQGDNLDVAVLAHVFAPYDKDGWS